jgi:hypothetical protein
MEDPVYGTDALTLNQNCLAATSFSNGVSLQLLNQRESFTMVGFKWITICLSRVMRKLMFSDNGKDVLMLWWYRYPSLFQPTGIRPLLKQNELRQQEIETQKAAFECFRVRFRERTPNEIKHLSNSTQQKNLKQARDAGRNSN